MKTWIDFDSAPVFAIPLTDSIAGVQVCEGMLIEGPQGWGEFSPPPGCSPERAARWLTAAIEVGTVGWPDPVRGRVPVAAIVPQVPAARAGELVAEAGCRTAAVTVGGALSEDLERVAAVRDALGPSGAVRVDAGGRWDAQTAVAAIAALDRAAGGLEFVGDPCPTLEETAAVRRRVGVRIAVRPARGIADAPSLADVADVAVLAVGALGGVRRALRVAETCTLPCVVAGGVETSIGLAGGVALAGVLPDSGFASALGGARLLSGDVVGDARSLIPAGGYLPVAPMPSAPDPELLRRYRADDAVAARWRTLLSGAQAHI